MTDQPLARRAKIELLVRRDDDEGFELKEISSAAAWVQLRPRGVEGATVELAEVPSRMGQSPSYILKNTKIDRFLLLTDRERFLWDRMDGHTSLQDMATAYVLKFGQFDFDVIPALIRKLQAAALLTFQPASRLRQALARNRRRRVLRAAETAMTSLERINISSRKVQPFFARLYRWGGAALFTRVAMAACLLLTVVGLVAAVRMWQDAEDVASGLRASPVLAILGVKLVLLLTVGMHQLVHGLAVVHFKRRVREFGFTFLHGFVPTFYVDVTDIFMASRRGRIITAVSGTLVHVVLGALGFLVAYRLAPGGFAKAFLATSAMLQWQAFVVALYPFCFIEMDGYHVLVDVLGVPTLKHDATAYVGRLLRGGKPGRWTREKKLWVGYVALSAVSVAAFIAFNVYLIHHATA
jgi:putative peptide zinc metalloprotease protein